MTDSLFPPSYANILPALNIQPFAGVGSVSVDYVYREVGRCCDAFETLQDELVLLFQTICGDSSPAFSKMARIIGATSSFTAKIELTRSGANSFLRDNPDHSKAVLEWLRLCRKAAEIRNKIAHGRAIQLGYVHEGASLQAAFLVPSFYSPKSKIATGRISQEAEYCWNAEQIGDYALAFHALRAVLMTVREELAGIGEESPPDVLNPEKLSTSGGMPSFHLT